MLSHRAQHGRLRRAVCGVAICIGALVGVAPSVGAASTGTTPLSADLGVGITLPIGVIPDTSSGCSGDVCIYLTNPSPGILYLEVWAYDANFYGHFQITGADTDADGNTNTQEWYGGAANDTAWAFESPSPAGQVCATAWTSSGQNLGKACETNG